ncbi:MAG: hypothetical protein WC145_10970 [Aliarcobacter sp.]
MTSEFGTIREVPITDPVTGTRTGVDAIVTIGENSYRMPMYRLRMFLQTEGDRVDAFGKRIQHHGECWYEKG